MWRKKNLLDAGWRAAPRCKFEKTRSRPIRRKRLSPHHLPDLNNQAFYILILAFISPIISTSLSTYSPICNSPPRHTRWERRTKPKQI